MTRPTYKIISIQELKQVAIEIFPQYDEIQLAYLYGSYARGVQTEFSDIDIGVLLKRDFKEPPLYFAELSLELEKYFKHKTNVDLRILNKGTPRFLFGLIMNSKILFVRDKTLMHEYELKIISKYQDIKPMLDKYDRISIMEVLANEN
ncbi:MAG: nucleotidyltransferase domain-containing protein [Promethearchaeota archaeon]|nr:MAG: nucleotidyltransferase domain-containing protein [Candidatus Lokiarchaeota archaeon]